MFLGELVTTTNIIQLDRRLIGVPDEFDSSDILDIFRQNLVVLTD
jgi:hypothetical protein